mmetsp:Transcript_26850/g.52372  ORF Transcript_26850/g.52372 Transcript_26850/m.52372 type:complete len:209 (-) Transcript_26850:982-1608(-)
MLPLLPFRPRFCPEPLRARAAAGGGLICDVGRGPLPGLEMLLRRSSTKWAASVYISPILRRCCIGDPCPSLKLPLLLGRTRAGLCRVPMPSIRVKLSPHGRGLSLPATPNTENLDCLRGDIPQSSAWLPRRAPRPNSKLIEGDELHETLSSRVLISRISSAKYFSTLLLTSRPPAGMMSSHGGSGPCGRRTLTRDDAAPPGFGAAPGP